MAADQPSIAQWLIPRGRVYVSGGIERIEFTLEQVQTAFDLPRDEMMQLVGQALTKGEV